MRKNSFCFFEGKKVQFLFLFILFLPFIHGVSEEGVSVTITLQGPPSLKINHPENKTYLYENNLPLNFTSNGGNFWYNIDNGENISVTGNDFFNTTQGNHILNLFANNSYGISMEEVGFSADPGVFNIYYEELNGSKKGSSTDFLGIPYEDFGDVEGVVLENTDFGKISFNENVNLTNDANPEDGILDLDSNINISFNRIEINSTALPNFNKSVNLYFYNLSFIVPRILRNGVVCEVCSLLSYSESLAIFNVGYFGSVYSLEEGYSELVLEDSSGGGSMVKSKEEFSLSKNEIQISLKQEEISRESFFVENKGEGVVDFDIELSESLERFIRLNESSFSLNSGESKEIVLDVVVFEDILPKYYFGNILVKSKDFVKSVFVLIDISSKESLFDVSLRLPKQFLKMFQGEELITTIDVVDVSDIGLVDILIYYVIEDFEGKIVLEESEMFAIDGKTSFIKIFDLPEDIGFGKYIVHVEVEYDGKKASSSVVFDVVSREKIYLEYLIGGSFLLVFLIIFLINRMFWKKRKKKK